MEHFRQKERAGRQVSFEIEEVVEFDDALVRTLIDIDLQTFSEPTFSNFTAAVLLQAGRVFLLKADNVVIGTCVNLRSWERPNEVTLLSMGIRPGWRGRGLGQAFLVGVIERMSAMGIRAVSLHVGDDNRRAMRVYRDCGFEPVGEPLTDPRTGDCLVRMRKQLQSDDPVLEFPS